LQTMCWWSRICRERPLEAARLTWKERPWTVAPSNKRPMAGSLRDAAALRGCAGGSHSGAGKKRPSLLDSIVCKTNRKFSPDNNGSEQAIRPALRPVWAITSIFAVRRKSTILKIIL
jgi:hypothetical protein